MSECKAYRREIVETWDDGGLSRGARSHVQTCRDCGDELRARESLRALVGGLCKVEAPPDFEFRLRARMASVNGGGGHRRRLRLAYAFAPVAAAACFFIIAASLYLRQPSGTVPASFPAGEVAETARNPADEQAKQRSPVTASNVEEAPVAVEAGGESRRVTLAAPQAGRRPRVAARQVREVLANLEDRGRPSPSTSLHDLGSASVITGQNVTIALKAPAEPLRMILRDGRGAGRVVPMRAVSFGAQELITREPALRRTAVAEDEGVW